jgi:hypothetical protein
LNEYTTRPTGAQNLWGLATCQALAEKPAVAKHHAHAQKMSLKKNEFNRILYEK